MDNFGDQCEEIEAITSIYGDQWQPVSDTLTASFGMQISPDIKLFITLNSDYPSHAPPSFELLAPTLTSEEKNQVASSFEDIHKSNMGSPILFQWIEKLKEIADKLPEKSEKSLQECVTDCDNNNTKEFKLFIMHGETIVDRKSVFQGHAAKVHSLEDVNDFMNYLMGNKKIAQATHNISAYRIEQANQVNVQDCDDDGETHAGSRVLHLLQILDVKNVMVVVSRWYGGIQLGPDRFKHVNNAARQVLVQAGFIK